VPAQISCGACSPCRRGLTGRCLSVPFGASYGMGRAGGFGGGLADLVRVPFGDAMLTALPIGTDPVALIGAADMALDAWRAVAPQIDANPEARVLVLGGMPAVIGLYAVGLAKAAGAPVVHYSDIAPARRAIAGSYGAELIDDADLSPGYDVIVVARPLRAALQQAFALAAPGAHVTSVTPAADGFPEIDTASLYHRGITWSIGRPDCYTGRAGALAAWAGRGFRLDLVPTKLVDWDTAPDAWNDDAVYVAAVRSDRT
jgi:threonine dehydrogenase-like Zn-dependent dehydrogenase